MGDPTPERTSPSAERTQFGRGYALFRTDLLSLFIAAYLATLKTRFRRAEHELLTPPNESALPMLEQAMKLIDPAAVRRLSRLLTYLGEAHLLLEHEQQAY